MYKNLKIIFFIFAISSMSMSHPADHSTYSWQIAPVFSLAALANGAGGNRYEIGAGLQGDVYLWRINNFLFGPGLSLAATKPLGTGNSSVRVSPYSLYSEQRFTVSWAYAQGDMAFMPFVNIFANLGVEIIHRQVRAQRSINMSTLIALGSRLGMSLWWKDWGVIASYDLSYGSNKWRQQMLISLAYNFITRA